MGGKSVCCCCNYKEQNGSNITFYCFPRNKAVRWRWILATNKLNLPTTKGLKVCSKHFKNDDFVCNFGQIYLRKNRVPSVFNLSDMEDNPEGTIFESDSNQMEPYIDAEETNEIGEDPLKSENEYNFTDVKKKGHIKLDELNIKIESEDHYPTDLNEEFHIKDEIHFTDDDSMDGEYTINERTTSLILPDYLSESNSNETSGLSKSNFKETCGLFESQSNENCGTVHKRKIQSWRMVSIFNTALEAEAAVKEEKTWSRRYKNKTDDGYKQYYRCNKVKYMGKQCSALMYLLFKTSTVSMFKNEFPHDHEKSNNLSSFFYSQEKEKLERSSEN